MVRNSSASAASRKINHPPRVIERDAARFQRPQIGDCDGKREGELLRLRAARIVDHAAVGRSERSGEALRGEAGDGRVENGRQRIP